MDLGPESLNCSNAPDFNFTLRWLLDLGNTSLEQTLRLKDLGFLLFISIILSYAIWLPHG